MATDDNMDVVMEDVSHPSATEGSEMPLNLPSLSFPVLEYVNDMRYKHGIRSEEYGRFHTYCSKRLGSLRRQLRSVTIKSNKYVHEELPEVIADTRHLEILVLRVERSWSYGMLLKSQCETSHQSKQGTRHQYVKRFEKARKVAVLLEQLCQQFADTNSANNAKVYRSLLEGIVHFEHKRYQDAFTCLSAYANVMDQRKRMYQESKPLSEGYSIQLNQVNAILKMCSFHLRVAGSRTKVTPTVKDEDQGADLVSVVPDAGGNLTLYCRGVALEISSQFLMQQVSDAIRSTDKLVVSDDTLRHLMNNDSIEDSIRNLSETPQEALMASYEEATLRIAECTDTIHAEVMSSIYDQGPFRRLEDVIMLIKTILEMEKCVIMEIITVYKLYLAHQSRNDTSALPDCDEAVRYAQILKQQLGIIMKDQKIAHIFLSSLEITKTINGMLLGMHKIASGEYNDGMALVNWAYKRQAISPKEPDNSLTRLIWRSLACFHVLHLAGKLFSTRYYRRSVAIFARQKLSQGETINEKTDTCKLFGLENRVLPCKPIIFDLAYIHNSPPELIAKKSSIIGGVKNMLASFWKSK